MNVSSFEILFSEARRATHQASDPSTFSLYLEDTWFQIPLASLSEREHRLLLELEAKSNPPKRPTNRWAKFLLEGTHTGSSDLVYVQLCQIKSKPIHQENFDASAWLEACKEAIPFVIDGFLNEEHLLTLVLHNPEYYDLVDELEGILNVLNDDFGILSTAFIGQNWPVSKELPHLYQEEQLLFQKTAPLVTSQRVLSLSSQALPYYTGVTAPESSILRTIKEAIATIEGGFDVVLAMWNHLGNISKAASALYLHRNTLQYRLDRFFQVTGLNLKVMDDLLLAYLAFTTRFDENDFHKRSQ